MRGFTRIGKFNVAIGLILLILGLLIFVSKFDNGLTLENNYLTIAFLCLGIALIFSSKFYKQSIK